MEQIRRTGQTVYNLFYRLRIFNEFTFMKLFIIPFVVTTIHMTIVCILYYPTEEKILIAKSIFQDFHTNNASDYFSVGWIGIGVYFR